MLGLSMRGGNSWRAFCQELPWLDILFPGDTPVDNAFVTEESTNGVP